MAERNPPFDERTVRERALVQYERGRLRDAAARGVLPGLLLALAPVGAGALVLLWGHGCSGVVCLSACAPACLLGGIVGGVLSGRGVAPHPGEAAVQLSTTGALAAVGAAVGCAPLGIGALTGLAAGALAAAASGLVAAVRFAVARS